MLAAWQPMTIISDIQGKGENTTSTFKSFQLAGVADPNHPGNTSPYALITSSSRPQVLAVASIGPSAGETPGKCAQVAANRWIGNICSEAISGVASCAQTKAGGIVTEVFSDLLPGQLVDGWGSNGPIYGCQPIEAWSMPNTVSSTVRKDAGKAKVRLVHHKK